MKAKDLIYELKHNLQLEGSIHKGKLLLDYDTKAVEGVINPRKDYYYTFKRPSSENYDVLALTREGKEIWMYSID